MKKIMLIVQKKITSTYDVFLVYEWTSDERRVYMLVILSRYDTSTVKPSYSWQKNIVTKLFIFWQIKSFEFIEFHEFEWI